MFINASAEYSNPEHDVHRYAVEHKMEILRLLRLEIESAGLSHPTRLADQIGILLEGAIVSAQLLGRSSHYPGSTDDIVQQARDICQQLISIA